jgi:pilus assembly protein CpaF
MGGGRLMDRVRKARKNATSHKGDRNEYEQLKHELHEQLIESISFDQVSGMPPDELRSLIQKSLLERVSLMKLPFNRSERERLVEEIVDNVLGLGPLEQLFRDKDISDIMINGAKKIFVERKGVMSKSSVTFDNDKQLMAVVERIVAAVGRRIDEQTPMVDARMIDGSRFNAIIPPLSLEGPCISIRRFGDVPITAEDLIAFGSCPRPMMELLRGAIKIRLNTIISGGTGSGKTTLLNVLSSFIPGYERIITIEDSAELRLQQTHVVRLETRPPNLEGRGEVTQRELIKNCLRMRPDRIILGEVRGEEAIDMLTAMNTGHDGSLGTVHANNTRDALARFETMVGIGMPNMGDQSIRETIARALDLVIQIDRLMDGHRRIMAITEVTGMEGSIITSQDIFTFEQETVDKDGKVKGAFRATGVRPRFATRLAAHGIRVSNELFKFEMEV